MLSFQRSESHETQKSKVGRNGHSRGECIKRGSIFCYFSSSNSLSPAETLGYFKSLESWRIPLFIEITV